MKERLYNVVNWKDPVYSTCHHLHSINMSHIANIIDFIAATSWQAKIENGQTWP